MSHLVKAIKSYAYMDRGEVVQVDVHEGLENTLTILNHKLKHTSIEVERNYDPTLPRLTVHGAALNQVWTNLIDNAIGALGDSGRLTITTRRDGDCGHGGVRLGGVADRPAHQRPHHPPRQPRQSHLQGPSRHRHEHDRGMRERDRYALPSPRPPDHELRAEIEGNGLVRRDGSAVQVRGPEREGASPKPGA